MDGATGRGRRTVTGDKGTPARSCGTFDIAGIAGAFPARADTMLVDTRLTDEAEASCRLFRIYATVPPHYHATCDEYLLVVSGRARFRMGDLGPSEIGPGRLIFFKKGTVHAIDIVEEPLVFLSVDTPRRDPRDVVFVNPADGTPDTFVRTKPVY
ncbi:MAG: cupin domain-containing protein [Acidobacteria bacterium]|nr:cupin domain-containing protein [Acidobacteriota bacterium]